MIVLALDTALAACSAAVVDEHAVRAAHSEPMTRGHQERLAPLVQETMAEAGLAFFALDRVGCTVGPGSFTGLRVGLAFAKALGLALDRPCIGVGTLESLAAGLDGFVAAAIEARGEQLYFQVFESGVALTAPNLLSVDAAAARLAELRSGGPVRIVGPGAARLAGVIGGAEVDPVPAPDPVALARLVARRAPTAAGPSPLYLRPPDARTIAERAADRAGAPP